VFEVATALSRNTDALRALGAEVYGPAPAPVARVRGKHRVRLLVKSAKTVHLQSALYAWRQSVNMPNNMRIQIDIDPQSFY
jgi:primosomal protein N' (replication factor Y)